MEFWNWLWLIVSYIVILIIIKVMVILWWIPRNIQKHFNKQGIRGPTYHFFFTANTIQQLAAFIFKSSSSSSSSSSQLPPMMMKPSPADDDLVISHNIVPRILSFYHHYKKIYGATFLLWVGSTARLTISDPIHIQEIFVSKSETYEKTDSNPFVRKLEGDGLLNLKGEKWAHHRKIISPTFHMENLKLMIPIIGKSVVEMLDKWWEMSNSIGDVEIEVSEWFQTLTEKITMRTIFGSNYEDGKIVFQLQAQQMVYAVESYQSVCVPGLRFLPTKKNIKSWILDKEIRASLMKLIERSGKSGNSFDEISNNRPKDLLDLMLRTSSNKNHERRSNPNSSSSLTIAIHDIIDECKGFFFAGKHTTSNLLTWTTILLAMHPRWQEMAREEVLSVCGARDIPTRDDVSKLKMVSMILYESLRLYPPVVATIRRAKVDVELGDYKIPRGTELLIPIVAVHHDPTLWGHDVSDFNPNRFSQGVARAAKHPMAFIPFALGARRCIGQNLAILQAKLSIAMILQRFSFDLAPTYQHVPTVRMLLYPKYGAPIIFHRLVDPIYHHDHRP